MMAKVILLPNRISVSSQPTTPKVRRKGKILKMTKRETELMKTEQVAQRLGYSVRTVTDWAQQYVDSGGQEGIPAFKLGRGWRFEKAALEEWISEKQKHKNVA